MKYPSLRRALDSYCRALNSSFKRDVNVRTGALRDSIRVTCTIDGLHYEMHVSLRYYWKFLHPALPLDLVYQSVGLNPPPSLPRADFDHSHHRYSFDFSVWQSRLNDAYEADVRAFLSE